MIFETIKLTHITLASIPIFVVLILMVGFRWGGAKAGPAGWLSALVVAVLFFGAGIDVITVSQAKAVLLALYVLYIIWMALILYNIVDEAGSIKVIGEGIVRLTGDRVLQLLILGWVFSAFLQGVAGFGVPIAVIAPLLIGIGFSPITAVASVAIGHSWSVTFGDIASSFNAMIVTTGIPGEVLAPWSGFLLGIACFCCGFAAVFVFEGFKSVRRGFVAILIMGTVMAGVQLGLAVYGLWNLAGFVAGLAGLVASSIVVRLKMYRTDSLIHRSEAEENVGGEHQKIPLPYAVAPYIALIVIVAIAELVPSAHSMLNATIVKMEFPETVTSAGWISPAAAGRKISVFGHAGALLAYASILTYVVYSLKGYFAEGAWKRILSKTTRSAVRSSIGIVSMVGFAMIMSQTGMTYLIAAGLSRIFEPVYGLLSPFIGLLGAFMTGSNTNSNVVFGGLQMQAAELLKLSVAVILSAQTTGGSLGSMLAPAKIIVGASTAGLAGQEGLVLRKTVVVGVIITLFIGVFAWATA
jgi:lactate permease